MLLLWLLFLKCGVTCGKIRIERFEFTDDRKRGMALTLEEQKRQEDLQRLRGLRPIDDDFMRCLFKDNIPLVELVLRIITGKPDLIITNCQTQKDMKRLGGARSICLDAYGTDTAGKKYDMEIQREDKGADPHRARYHSSVMDVENLDARLNCRTLIRFSSRKRIFSVRVSQSTLLSGEILPRVNHLRTENIFSM